MVVKVQLNVIKIRNFILLIFCISYQISLQLNLKITFVIIILNLLWFWTIQIFKLMRYFPYSIIQYFLFQKKFKKNFNHSHDSRYPIPTNESISRKKLSFWLPRWPLCPQTFRTVPPMFCQTRYVDRRWSVLTKSPSQCKNKSGGSTRWRTSG